MSDEYCTMDGSRPNQEEVIEIDPPLTPQDEVRGTRDEGDRLRAALSQSVSSTNLFRELSIVLIVQIVINLIIFWALVLSGTICACPRK